MDAEKHVLAFNSLSANQEKRLFTGPFFYCICVFIRCRVLCFLILCVTIGCVSSESSQRVFVTSSPETANLYIHSADGWQFIGQAPQVLSQKPNVSKQVKAEYQGQVKVKSTHGSRLHFAFDQDNRLEPVVKRKLAVAEIDVDNSPWEVTIQEAIATAINTPDIIVLERSQIRSVHIEKMMHNPEDIRQIFSEADLVIVGSARLLSGEYLVNLRVVDIASGQVILKGSEKCKRLVDTPSCALLVLRQFGYIDP